MGQAILVVEDEILIRLMIVDFLQDEGFITLEAGSGEEALMILLSEEIIDLVISDVCMPGTIDGVQLTVESKRRDSSLPVLITSCHLPTGCECPADAFLSKPFLNSNMLALVNELIGPGNRPTGRSGS